MSVLVDTSIWIEYFRSGNHCDKLDFFIDENLMVTNDLILAELVPSLKVRNQQKIIELLHTIRKVELYVQWEQIIDFQFQCLQNGFNGIGIPDLIIAQNALQNRCEIYTLDQHFKHIKDILELKLVD